MHELSCTDAPEDIHGLFTATITCSSCGACHVGMLTGCKAKNFDGKLECNHCHSMTGWVSQMERYYAGELLWPRIDVRRIHKLTFDTTGVNHCFRCGRALEDHRQNLTPGERICE